MAQQMLVHIDWTDRIYSAWYLIGKEERTLAATLDYDIYQNLWPNLDFCKPSFDAEAMDWVVLQSNGGEISNSSVVDVTMH